MHGLLVLDKPIHLTSRDAVDRAQRWFPRGTKLGHTGTLDPLATGVLVLTVGHATRLAEYVQNLGKAYLADIEFGATSATDDADGPVTPFAGADAPTRAALDESLAGFVGYVEQVPPAFSAAKIAGRRAYAIARQGETVELAARRIRIDRIDVLAYEWPKLVLAVACGKGTYIRSLARDLGQRLGCGGYLTGLRRTGVGPFTADRAVPFDADAATAHAALRPMSDAVVGLPQARVSADDATRLRNGQQPATTLTAAEVAVVDPAGALVAIAAADGRALRPLKVFPA